MQENIDYTARCKARDYHVGIGGFGYCTDCGFTPAEKLTPPFPADHPIWTHTHEEASKPLTFTLTIELGGEGMQSGADVMAAVTDSLTQWAGRSGYFPGDRELTAKDFGTLSDINGAVVGSWSVK